MLMPPPISHLRQQVQYHSHAADSEIAGMRTKKRVRSTLLAVLAAYVYMVSKIASWNPLWCASDDRWNEILQNFPRHDVVILTATGKRIADEERAISKHTYNIPRLADPAEHDAWTAVQWGWHKSTFDNKSCGFAMAFFMKWSRCIRRLRAPPVRL